MLEKIKEILECHVGEKNSITSGQIAEALGINEDDTHAKTRDLLLQTAENFMLPLAATNKGYYLIETEEEYNNYMHNLQSRKLGIDKRVEIITQNYRGNTK